MQRPQVLVTGGSARIGGALSRRFADDGWHVVIHTREHGSDVQAFADRLPSSEVVACDLSDSAAAMEMVKQLAHRLDDWRCLINSASIFRPDDVTGLDLATNMQAMQVNAISPARMAQAYLGSARARGGRCAIQITDQKLENPNPDFFSYTMSKHALDATIPMLAMGAAAPEDRVYGLAPGAILASHDQSQAETEVSHRLNLLQRKTGAKEVADAALFLAGGALRSGSTLFVDSGQHLMAQPRDVIFLAREMEGNGGAPA